jgi:hypothetical protein
MTVVGQFSEKALDHGSRRSTRRQDYFRLSRNFGLPLPIRR